MNLNLKNKNVFISGSTEGIGFATAKKFLEEEANVYINGKSKFSLEKAINKLKTLVPNSKINGFATDFTKLNQIKLMIKNLPPLDILINNLGIYYSNSFFNSSDAEWLEHFEINVLSGVRLSREILPTMLKKNQGRILFISSECATLVPADLIPYSVSKASILALSRGIAQLTKNTNVTVNTIIPGSTFTQGAEEFLNKIALKENKDIKEVEKDFFNNFRSNSLINRFANVDEIANTIVYFSSPLSSATNGATIKIDGGSMGGIL